MLKEIKMYEFSKPMDTSDELDSWRQWFLGRGLYAEALVNDKGKYVLWVQGKEAEHPNNSPEPIAGPCILCGSTEHIGSNRYRFKYCSEDCMDIDRAAKHNKYTKKED
jgi:hypothetical protein